MIGIDTNILVRYIAQDDRVQSPLATRFIESTCSVESPGFVSLIAIVELVWVVEAHYGAMRQDISRIVSQLLRARQLVVEQAETVWQALRAYENGKADFADCLIERLGAAVGCARTVTFDRDAAKSGMTLLSK